MDWLTSVPIAHRGLHDAQTGTIENSSSAFAAAIEAGYGIECDVQMSADEEAIVFHDHNLNRLTEASGPLKERSAKDICGLQLTGGKDKIGTLGDLLDQVAGKVPLLIEIKALKASPGPLEQRVEALLQAYQGPVAVMSFNPQCLAWFGTNAPDVVRGQLSMNFRRGAGRKRPYLQRLAARHLLVNRISKPHFVGYDIIDLPAFAPSFVRKMGTPILAWTVKTEQQQQIALGAADNIIFEGFKPPLDWASARE